MVGKLFLKRNSSGIARSPDAARTDAAPHGGAARGGRVVGGPVAERALSRRLGALRLQGDEQGEEQAARAHLRPGEQFRGRADGQELPHPLPRLRALQLLRRRREPRPRRALPQDLQRGREGGRRRERKHSAQPHEGGCQVQSMLGGPRSLTPFWDFFLLRTWYTRIG